MKNKNKEMKANFIIARDITHNNQNKQYNLLPQHQIS